MTVESPEASVVITTRNRCKELRTALRSCEEQTGVAYEVLVYDDASTDDTRQVIENEFIWVRYLRQEERTGYIALRNLGFQDARGEFVFSIDDDALFTDPHTVATVVDKFRQFPAVAAFALQFTEPKRTARQGFMSEIGEDSEVRNYIGCAHAIRREVARRLGGYPEYLIHQGEERDLCLRMLDAEYEIRYLKSPPIIHNPSQSRDHKKIGYLGLRNTFLFDVVNVPYPAVLWRLPADVILLLKHRITLNEFPRRLWYTIRALMACIRYLPQRKAVSRVTYSRYRTLPAHGAVSNVTKNETVQHA
ncbi:MAG TPA: glycosyltransferase [Pirellulaceae bacterium]|nr:glycosyltransferase [Pirellulaceae bacterium]